MAAKKSRPPPRGQRKKDRREEAMKRKLSAKKPVCGQEEGRQKSRSPRRRGREEEEAGRREEKKPVTSTTMAKKTTPETRPSAGTRANARDHPARPAARRVDRITALTAWLGDPGDVKLARRRRARPARRDIARGHAPPAGRAQGHVARRAHAARDAGPGDAASDEPARGARHRGGRRLSTPEG